jgi:hypothetical protein
MNKELWDVASIVRDIYSICSVAGTLVELELLIHLEHPSSLPVVFSIFSFQ